MQTWKIDFQGMEETRRLRGAIEERVAELARLYKAVEACRVVATGARAGKRQGLYEIEIGITLADGRDIKIGRNRGPDERYEDFGFALDDTFRRARRRLKDHFRGSKTLKGKQSESASPSPEPERERAAPIATSQPAPSASPAAREAAASTEKGKKSKKGKERHKSPAPASPPAASPEMEAVVPAAPDQPSLAASSAPSEADESPFSTGKDKKRRKSALVEVVESTPTPPLPADNGADSGGEAALPIEAVAEPEPVAVATEQKSVAAEPEPIEAAAAPAPIEPAAEAAPAATAVKAEPFEAAAESAGEHAPENPTLAAAAADSEATEPEAGRSSLPEPSQTTNISPFFVALAVGTALTAAATLNASATWARIFKSVAESKRCTGPDSSETDEALSGTGGGQPGGGD